jgi:hypothetical protein
MSFSLRVKTLKVAVTHRKKAGAMTLDVSVETGVDGLWEPARPALTVQKFSE